MSFPKETARTRYNKAVVRCASTTLNFAIISSRPNFLSGNLTIKFCPKCSGSIPDFGVPVLQYSVTIYKSKLLDMLSLVPVEKFDFENLEFL